MTANNSFKPNLLRYTKHMAEKACHVFGSTTQVGLTQVLGPMPKELMLIALATASAAGTVWVYWAVPRRVVANWAIGMGIGYATISAMLWLFFAGAFDTPPISRIAGGVALGLGVATGGVVARVLHRFDCPTRQDGA